jgi:RHS repeat-associated protein
MKDLITTILKTVVIAILLLCFYSVKAQTIGPLALSSPNTTGNYSSNVIITLSTGFSSSGPFSAGIQVIDCLPLSTSPSLNQNYVITNTPRVAGITDESQLSGQGTCALMQAIQYVDGLGRPIQTLQVMASPFGYDVVQPHTYDQYGREITKYLPYVPITGTAGTYRPNAVSTDQNAFYNSPPQGVSKIANPYTQTNFDNSPLNRAVEQGAPGAPWQLSTSGVSGSGHTVKMVYTLNNSIAWATDSVNSRQAANYYVTINSDNSRTLHNNGYYNANALTVTISKDENWVSGRAGTVEEYKDIDGQVVLKRVYNYSGTRQQLSTYYVYDDLGKLAFVLPPASGADGAGALSQTTLDNLCYQYQYDERGRPIQKKTPGKGWEYTVYNTMDQPVASQDANQRVNNQWMFTKYDALGRPVMTGIWNNSNTAITRAALQSTLTSITTNLYEASTNTGNGYTNVAWPTGSVTATLTTNYYDSYANIPGLPSTYTISSGVSQLTRGLTTVKKTAVLNTPTDQLWDVMYYDDLGRTTKTYAQHYLGGTASISTNNYDLTTITFNFTNAPTTNTRQHWNTASTTVPLLTIANRYIYDHMGRKLKTWEQITNGNQTADTRTLISKIDYNEIGQVLTMHLHSTDSLNFLQNIAYTYNEPGWMLTSSAPLFAMQLYYNTGTNKQYNGNIAYQYWGTPGNLNKTYTYRYDKLNRLLSGVSTDNNNETGITYDQMGNITALNRYQAGTLIDQLAYTYTLSGDYTNQLQSINDGSGNDLGLKHGPWTYTYDSNGNLITDPSKGTSGINIGYNLLNLPQNITGSKTITYTYDATGNKLRRVSPATGNTDYISGIQYDGGVLSFIQTEEGKAAPNGTGYNYVYYLGDNLGNTRVTFDTKTGAAVSVQQDDYYPFGMEIARTGNGTKNEYLYNKKELQEELTEYDYGARFYDPVIARWNVIDPLAEEDRRTTPYAYTFDDPIRHTDPDGMFGQDANDDGDCCKTAKIVLGTGLAIAGGEVVVAAPTVVGEAVAIPAAVVTTGVTLVLAGGAVIYDALFGSNSSAPTLEKPAVVQARDNNREGKDFTPKGKKTVIDDNKANNNGKVVCQGCKVETTKPEQSKKGVTPPTTDTQVDHKKPKSKGGKGTPDNGQVLCRGCNVKKSNKEPTPTPPPTQQ